MDVYRVSAGAIERHHVEDLKFLLIQVASIYGMNIIVFPETNFGQVVVVLAVIVAIMAVMFRWVKRQGWWWFLHGSFGIFSRPEKLAE